MYVYHFNHIQPSDYSTTNSRLKIDVLKTCSCVPFSNYSFGNMFLFFFFLNSANLAEFVNKLNASVTSYNRGYLSVCILCV